jgi:TrmH family RNA methyltransferase
VVWLLAGVAYPGNAGFAIRTAEVSGAAGIVLDAPLDGSGRKAALRASMRADWLFPVLWGEVGETLAAAQSAVRRGLALEDAGGAAPWEADLSGELLVVVGGERAGLPEAVLAAADARVRVPMAGFIPSYNVQAAVSALAVELLRRDRRPRPAQGGP